MCRAPPVLGNASALLLVGRAAGVRARGGTVLEVPRVLCVCVCVCVRSGGWPDSLSFLCKKERVFLVCP